MKKHTKGPWSLDFGDGGAVIYEEGVGTIANVPDDLIASSYNAALIAAAPELLAALKRLVEEFGEYYEVCDDAGQQTMDAAHAAIAKAEGGR